MVAVIGPHIGRGREPGTPAKLVLGAITVRARRSVDRRAGVIRVPAILSTLKDVAQHVVEAKRGGFERTDGCRVDVAIITGECRPPRKPAWRAWGGRAWLLTPPQRARAPTAGA